MSAAKLELYFDENEDLSLIHWYPTETSSPQKSRQGDQFRRGPAVIAMALYFVQLKIFTLKKNGVVSGFRFVGKWKGSPAASLRDQLYAKDGWIKDCFSNPFVVIHVFPHGEFKKKPARVLGFRDDSLTDLKIKVCLVENERPVESTDELRGLWKRIFKKGKWPLGSHDLSLLEPEKYQVLKKVKKKRKTTQSGVCKDESPVQSKPTAADLVKVATQEANPDKSSAPIFSTTAAAIAIPSNAQHPFCSLQDMADDPMCYLFPRKHDFIPDASDYLNDKLFRSDRLQMAESMLATHGSIVIEGACGSGKTTLALQLGFERFKKKWKVFYVDLSDPYLLGKSENILNLFRQLVGKDTLFILDNVFWNRGLAKLLFLIWSGNPKGSNLVSIRLREEPHNASLADPHNVIRTFTDNVAFAGVFDAFMQRKGFKVKESTTGLIELATAWKQTFADDYVAFLTAALNRSESLLKGDFSLDSKDSAEFVDSRYRSNLSESETKTLLPVAIATHVGAWVPSTLLDYNMTTKFSTSGVLMRRSSHEKLYGLPHRSIAKAYLLLYQNSPLISKTLCRITNDNPLFGLFLVSRLPKAGMSNEAETAVKFIASTEKILQTIIYANIYGISILAGVYLKLEHYTKPVDELLYIEAALLEIASFTGPLSNLNAFLSEPAKHLPRCHKRIVGILKDTRNTSRLFDLMVSSAFEDLFKFLKWAKNYHDKEVKAAVSVSLEREENQKLFLRKIMNWLPNQIARFQEVLLDVFPKDFVLQIVASSEKFGALRTLPEKLLALNLNVLIVMLKNIWKRETADEDFEIIRSSWERPEHISAVVARALSLSAKEFLLCNYSGRLKI